MLQRPPWDGLRCLPWAGDVDCSLPGELAVADDAKLEALIHESANLHDAIQRLYGAIYAGFGAVMPAAIGVFLVVTTRENGKTVDPVAVSLIFLAAYALGSLWLQSLWMELLEHLRYRYLVLYPLIYEASGQQRPNFLETITPRSLRSWLPSLLFQVAGLGFVIWVWHHYLTDQSTAARVIGLAFICLAVAGGVAVHLHYDALQRAIVRAGAKTSR